MMYDVCSAGKKKEKREQNGDRTFFSYLIKLFYCKFTAKGFPVYMVKTTAIILTLQTQKQAAKFIVTSHIILPSSVCQMINGRNIFIAKTLKKN